MRGRPSTRPVRRKAGRPAYRIGPQDAWGHPGLVQFFLGMALLTHLAVVGGFDAAFMLALLAGFHRRFTTRLLWFVHRADETRARQQRRHTCEGAQRFDGSHIFSFPMVFFCFLLPNACASAGPFFQRPGREPSGGSLPQSSLLY